MVRVDPLNGVMRVIGVQYDIAWEHRERNFRTIERMVAEARPAPGSWVVLPEMYSTGFSFRVDKVEEGDDRPGEAFLAGLAQRYGVQVIGGVVRRAGDGRGRNQAVVFGADGSELGRYTKIHPFSFAGEDKHYATGTRPLVFAFPHGSISPLVCYDLRFPEAFRSGARTGTDLFAVIANWPVDRIAHWEALLRARAIENQAYVIGVNRIGDDPKLHYPGHTMIVDPRGEILERLVESGGTVQCDLDLEDLRAYRKSFPGLDDIHDNLLGERADVVRVDPADARQ